MSTILALHANLLSRKLSEVIGHILKNFKNSLANRLANTIMYDKIVYTKVKMCSDQEFVETLKNFNMLNPSVDTRKYTFNCENDYIYTLKEEIGKGANNSVHELTIENDDDHDIEKVEKVIRITNEHSNSEISLFSDENTGLLEEITGLFLQCFLSNECSYICKIYEFGLLISPSYNLRVYSIIERLDKPNIHNDPKIIISQVSNALNCMNKDKFVHLDVKPENIGIDKDGNAKLIDFGSAQYLVQNNGPIVQVVGTKRYIAPEIFKNTLFYNSDVYSLGFMLFLYYFQYNSLDYDPESNCVIINSFIRYRYDGPEELKDQDTKILIELIENMMKPDPNQRYTIEQVLNHEWFNTTPKTVIKSAKESAKKRKRGGKSVKKQKRIKIKKETIKKQYKIYSIIYFINVTNTRSWNGKCHY